MLDYLEPNATFMLREAIAQLREEDAKNFDVACRVSPHLERSIMAHDAVHVLFACDTSDKGEAIAHAWMLLGTTVTPRQLRDVMATRDHRTFAGELGHGRRVLALLSALPSIAVAALRARRMNRRWSWTEYDRYLDTPLANIRSEYGIRLRTERQMIP